MISHLYRRHGIYWFDARDDNNRWRESLETRNRHEAEEKLRERLQNLTVKTPSTNTKAWRQMTVTEAITKYADTRRAQVSPRMFQFWKEQIAPLAKHFGDLKLKQLTPDHFTEYQNAMLDQARAPKTINNNLGALRQVLKHCKLLYRFTDYKPIPNNKEPVGKALTDEELERLYTTAKSRPEWLYASTASTLAFFLGMRRVEIRHLRWQDVDFASNVLDIRRSKTKAGHRSPPLNDICREALLDLYVVAKETTGAAPDHYLFPAGGKDVTQPMKDWRSAWRSLRKAAGLDDLRFHDGRHCAITSAGEKGVPEQTMQGLFGHIDPAMLKRYSHTRRRALEDAANALQPTFTTRAQTAVEMVN